MKKAITKFWGIGLVVVLLASLFVAAAPASGDDLRWSVQGIPLGLAVTYQLAPGTDAAFVQVAPNGDIFVADTQAASATLNRVMKSTTGGRTWTPSAALAGIGAMNIVDIVVSPSYTTDGTVLLVTAPAAGAGATSQVYISTNYGASFSVLGGTIPGLATSIDISPSYSAGGEIMVGTTDAAGAAATYGDVYFWGRGGVLNWATATVGLGEDVTQVAYSPNFPIDATRLAIGSNVANGTRVHTLVGTDGGWDVSLATIAVINAAIQGTGDGAAVAIASSTIAIPSDFNASSLFNRTLYAGTISGGAALADTVYRVTAASAAPAVALNPLAIFAIADQTMSSLVYVGTAASGTLYTGYSVAMFVMQASNAGTATAAVPPTWIPSTAGPTGGTMVYLAPAPDIATSGRIYASSIGAESALSVSDDRATFFYQAGLVDTAATVVDDFQAASATELFMVQSNGATISVWKTTDAGATWYRRLAVASALTGIVRLSPNYATDGTAYFGLVTSAAAGNMRVTSNGGASWTARTCPIAVGDIAVKDMYTAYISLAIAGGTVQSTSNGGWTWQPFATVTAAAQIITDIKYDVATGHIMVGLNNGGVMLSTNSNVSYLPLGVGIGGTNTIVAFDTDYANTNFVYAASVVGGTADVKRFQVGTYTAWLVVGSAVPVAAPRDLMVANGTLYMSDVTAAAGFSSCINPTAGLPTAAVPFTTWNNAIGLGLAANSTITVLAIAPGSNVIYGYDAANNLMYTYGDTISGVAPNALGPVGSAIVDAAANPVIFSWENVPGALAHQVRWDTRADFFTQRVRAAVAWPTNIDVQIPGVAASLPSGFTIYWQVRASAPLIGPWSEAQTFETQLAAAAINSPVPIGLPEGGTVAGGWDTNINPTFQWNAIAFATAYEFQLATDAAFTDLIVDASGANSLGVVTAYKLTTGALDYNTTYYWRVRAISASSSTDWSPTAAFTTMAAPEPPAPPPVEVVTSPAPIINIPEAPPAQEIVIPPAPAPEQIAPAYIWAIIIIGAVLVIAVIVLIVRTRRQV
jgi:hypothetical protein